jgi:hypothetical protein
MFSDLIAVSGDVTHLLVDVGVVISLPTFITHPSGDVLDNNERLTMPKVFTPPYCFQTPFTTPDADFTCHGRYFFRSHMLSL